MLEVKRYGVLSGNLTDGTSGYYTQVVDARHYDAAQSKLAALREELSLSKDMAASWKSSADGLAEEAKDFHQRLTAAEQQNAVLVALMQEFCDRVDRGEVRSTRTYAKFKAALKPTESGASGKCTDCHGSGQHCMAGHSAHPDNWHDCETCKGSGKV